MIYNRKLLFAYHFHTPFCPLMTFSFQTTNKKKPKHCFWRRKIACVVILKWHEKKRTYFKNRISRYTSYRKVSTIICYFNALMRVCQLKIAQRWSLIISALRIAIKSEGAIAFYDAKFHNLYDVCICVRENETRVYVMCINEHGTFIKSIWKWNQWQQRACVWQGTTGRDVWKK